MTRHIGGYRNGEPWPAIGGTIDVGDAEAADLVAAGYATEAPDEENDAATDNNDQDTTTDDVETGTAGDDAAPAEDDKPARKGKAAADLI